MNILMIEDEVRVADIMMKYLQKEGSRKSLVEKWQDYQMAGQKEGHQWRNQRCKAAGGENPEKIG